jgi:hypothetical protein
MSTPLNTITPPPKRVLLVEDSEASRIEIIKEAQQSFPGQFDFFEMEKQSDAQQWLKAERAAGRTVDLIMLDGTTEGRYDNNDELRLDALDFLEFLKAENILNIPVLGISGKDDSNRKIGKQCWQYGITVNARNKDGSEERGPSATYDLVSAGMKLIDKARAAQASTGTPG